MGRKKIVELTAADLSALAFIQEYARERQQEPTYTLVGKHLGLSTPTNSRGNITRLVEHGRLEWGDTRERPYRIPGFVPGLTLPLLGATAAGPPLPGEPWDDLLSLSAHFNKPDLFVLRVRGDSMIGAAIRDKDYVVLRSGADSLRAGDVAVFRARGGYTLKKYRRGRWEQWSDPDIRLESANPAVPPIELDEELDADATPVGVLVGVIRVGVR